MSLEDLHLPVKVMKGAGFKCTEINVEFETNKEHVNLFVCLFVHIT